VVLVLADMVEENPPLTDAFVAELASRLQGHGQALLFPMTWLEQRLAEQGQTVDHIFNLASQSQAADQVSIGNSIGSLRFLNAADWRVFVEEMSVVEQTLRRDPMGAYAAMDFATRDRYRHAVEAIARRSALAEDDVARVAVAMARDAHRAEPDGRRAHVGYFLIDEGRPALERAARMRRSPVMWVRRALHRLQHVVYGGAILATTALVAVLLGTVMPTGLDGVARVAWWALLTVCSSQVAVAVVHWAATMLVPPRILPRLDFSEGIPAAHATVVAVPTLLTDAAEIDELVEALEVRFLANRDENLGFALLGDFRDAPTATAPGDAALLQRAEENIQALNEKYAGGKFFLFHRARRWNPSEGVWMGRERKRGKLEDFNATLRGEAGHFATVVGDVARLQDVKYVITLDADTGLPRDAARALTGTMAHPLNRPVHDETRGRVTAGYAILQPRVAVSMLSTARTRFARMFAGEPGIDPYTRAVSDVFQDVFGEGSFIGKGIYDVDALRRAIGGRFPENRVLSHDLLEGAHARAGLVRRRRARRGLPVHVLRRDQPPPPLDPRRLADRALALARRARGPAVRPGPTTPSRGCRSGRCSTTCAAAWCPSR
jgi:hypothetical protein